MFRRLQLVLGAFALLACFHAAADAAPVTFVPNDLDPGDTYHVAFVTQGSMDVMSGNIVDYNSFVQIESELSGAETENWGVNWFAVASTSMKNAKDNISVTTSPVYLLNGPRLADDANDLWDGSIGSSLSTNQFNVSSIDTIVLTGTGDDGEGLEVLGLGPGFTIGLSPSTNFQWVGSGSAGGGAFHPMYAISDTLTVAAIPEPSTLGTCMLLSSLGALGRLGRRRRR